MVTITDSTLRASIFEVVYDKLTANIGSYNSSSQPSVMASYTGESKNLPEIVVHGAEVGKEQFSLDRSNSVKNIDVMIDLWTKKKKDIDLLSDDVSNLFEGSSISGLMMTGWSESNALETPNNNKLHLKTIIINFMR